MTTNQVEIEIKALLGDSTAAKKLISRMKQIDHKTRCINRTAQLNHYFLSDSGTSALTQLRNQIKTRVSSASLNSLDQIIQDSTQYSVRTRRTETETLLIVKATLDSTSSENGTARTEWETTIPQMGIDDLDKIILSCGFSYQSKWSRERHEYLFMNMHVCIDKNAGYGYLAEFERICTQDDDIEAVKSEIRGWMKKLAIAELPQERLERMFVFYNAHWAQYYGTTKTFSIQ